MVPLCRIAQDMRVFLYWRSSNIMSIKFVEDVTAPSLLSFYISIRLQCHFISIVFIAILSIHSFNYLVILLIIIRREASSHLRGNSCSHLPFGSTSRAFQTDQQFWQNEQHQITCNSFGKYIICSKSAVQCCNTLGKRPLIRSAKSDKSLCRHRCDDWYLRSSNIIALSHNGVRYWWGQE